MHLAGLASTQEQHLDNIFPVFTIVFDLCVDRIVYCAGRCNELGMTTDGMDIADQPSLRPPHLEP